MSKESIVMSKKDGQNGYLKLKDTLEIIAKKLRAEGHNKLAEDVVWAAKFYGGTTSDFMEESWLVLNKVIDCKDKISKDLYFLAHSMAEQVRIGFEKVGTTLTYSKTTENDFDKCLVGKSVIFTISESLSSLSPPVGNKLLGTIIKLQNNLENEQVVICEIEPFNTKKQTFSQIVVTKRHQLRDTLSELLCSDNSWISVNVGYENVNNENDRIDMQYVTPFFVGGIKLTNIKYHKFD